MAGRGHGFPGDPVHLVEGVRSQVTVICCSDEHLQVDGFLTVANELRHGRERERKRGGSRVKTDVSFRGLHERCEHRNPLFISMAFKSHLFGLDRNVRTGVL